MKSLVLLFLSISKTFAVFDPSNHNGYDWSHLPTGISLQSERNDLVTKIRELEEAFETQSGRHIGQDLFLQTMRELIDEGGIEPVEFDDFVAAIEDETVLIQATDEYITAKGNTIATGNTGNTGAGSVTSRKRRSPRHKRDLNCVGCSVPLDLRDLEHYGCWCNMGSTLMDGQSEPLDEFDQACRVLQHGLRCVGMDNEDRQNPDEPCDPRVNPYNVPFFFFGGLEASCQMVNPGTFCSWKYCMCQTHWVNGVLDLSFQGLAVDHSLKHSDPGFDYNTRCPVAASTTQATIVTNAPGGGGNGGGGGNNPVATTSPNNGGPGFQNGGNGGNGIPNPFLPNIPASSTFAASSTNAVTNPTTASVPVFHDCCGNYPVRTPYSSKRHLCCESALSLFDPNLSECCDATSSVVALGVC